MILVILTALTAVCGAAKLDKGYLPPISARTAGGSPGALQAPFDGTNQGLGLPTGGYTNDAQGVIVDAVNPGTRTSGVEPTGLGGPRTSYGSTNSKVGDAAFSGFKNPGGVSTRIAPGFDSFVGTEDSDASKTRGSTLKFATDVGLNNYSYGFETDNGISVGENGNAENGVQAQGGYSYKGDDGKTYEVTYTADEGGYKPQGHHLPTPPPIPDEIIKSLEKNAKEEAAGLVDDGSYDAQKYNDGSDYSSNSAANHNARPTIGGGDATASASFVNQDNEAYRPSSGFLIGSYNPGTAADQSSEAQGAQGYGHGSGNQQSGFSSNKEQSGSQGFGVSGDGAAIGAQFGQLGSTSPQASNNFGTQGKFGANSQFNSQSTLNSQSAGNSFGIQASKPEGSVFGSPVGTPSFNSLPGSTNENSAFSSAVSSGFGSASAFASTGASSFGLKNENIRPINNFGLTGQYNEGFKSGSDSKVGASFPAPSAAVASASVSGTPTFGQQYSGSQQPSVQGSTALPQFPTTLVPSNTQFGSPSYSQNQAPNLPSTASASASVSGNQHVNGFQAESNQNKFPSRFGESQQFGHTTTNSENQKPVNILESTSGASHLSKPQGFDSSSTASNVNFQSSSSASGKPSSSGSSAFGDSSQQSTFQAQSFNSKPSQYSPVNNVISSSAGLPQFGNTNTKFSSVQPTKPTVGFGNISSQEPTKVPSSELTTPFESTGSASVQTSNQASNSFTSGNIPVPSPADAAFASSTQQPALNQQQGSDFSYYYKQPSKPFVTPPLSLGSQFSNNRQPNPSASSSSQQESNYPNAPTPSTTGQLQSQSSSSYNNGVTQAAISPFPSLTSSTQFTSQSDKFGSTPTSSTQFGQSSQSSLQTSSQFGNAGAQQLLSEKPISQFGQKPIDQSQSSISQNSDSNLSSTQQYQGTVYQYNKPAETLSVPANADSQAKPSQISTDSRFGSQQVSSQFSSQSIGSIPTSTFQQTQTAQGSTIGSQSNSLFSQKPNSQGQYSQTSQFGQKPVTSSFNYQQSQFGGPGSQLNLKPQTPFGSTFSFNKQDQQSVFGKKPTPSTQSGSYYQQTTPSAGLSSSSSSVTQKPSSFGQKPFGSSQKTGSFAGQATQSSSLTSSSQSQGQTSQVGQKPFGSTFQKPQFGTTGSHSGQGNGLASSAGQTSFGQKPLGSSYQQSQFNQFSSQFGQKPQSLTQSSAFVSNTGSKGQSTSTSQFGATAASQSSQSLQGNGFTSTTGQASFGQKPFGSSYQQAQFGSTGSQFNQFSSQFGQKPVSPGSSLTSSTGSKGQSAQTSQFGVTGASQNSQSLQGNSFASAIGQTTFGQKPIGSSYQQSQFGSTTSQFGQNSQTQGSGLLSSAGQSSFSQKPGSTNQQFGSTNSQSGFAQKPQSAQESFTSNTESKGQSGQSSQFGVTGSSQASFGQKPFGSFQQSQFGTTGSKFGEKPQITQGSSFSSNKFSQTQTSQFGKKPSTTTQSGSTFQISQNSQAQGSGLFSSAGQSSFGQKPTTTIGLANQQFGSSNSQFGFGQKPQSTQGSYFTNTGSKGQSGQTSQFGVTGSAQNSGSSFSIGSGSSSQQTQFSGFSGSTQKPQTTFSQTSSQFGVKPFGSSQSTQGVQQTQFGSTASQYGQTSQSSQVNVPTLTTTSQTAQPTPFGQKPFSISQSQFGSSSSVLGQKPLTTQLGQKPSFGSYSQFSQFDSQTKKPFSSTQKPFLSQFSSTTGKFGQQPQAQANAFASSSSPDAGKFGSTQSSQGSKYQQTSQFGVQGQKPVQSSLSQTDYQQSQYTQTSGSGQFGSQSSFGVQAQKPLGSQFGTFQTQLNQKPVDQKTQPTQSSITTTNVASQSAESAFGSAQTANGYGYNKPQNAFNFASKFGGQANGPQDQKVQSSQTSFNSEVSTSQTQVGGAVKPFGSSSAQAQSSSGSSQFGVQPIQATDFNVSPSQSSITQFSGQPFQPVSTVSTQSSSFQSQTSSTSNSQFGVQPTKPSVVAHFTGQPFKPASTQDSSSFGSQNLFGQQSLQNVAATTTKPSQSQFSVEPSKAEFSSTPSPSFPSRLGSSAKPEGLVVSTLQTPIIPVPGYEIITSNQGVHGEFGGPRDPPRFDDKTGYYY